MSRAAESIFAKLVSGRIPCECVFQDEYVFAFLDINPLAEGHTLVLPKRPVERLADLQPEESAAIGRRLPELSRRIATATGVSDCNILLNDGAPAGQEVPYVHFHIIPRRKGDGLGYRWSASKADPVALAALAGRIRSLP